MKALKVVMIILAVTLGFFLRTLPSIVYGITPYFLLPLGWLIRFFVGRPILSYKAGIIALKLSTVVLLVVVPSVLYIYVWKPLGWAFFAWMGLYLIIRLYSETHAKESDAIDAWKHLDALVAKHERTYTKFNPVLTIITVVLSIAAPILGYYLGKEQGLWFGVAVSAIIWCISPFARETIVEK